MNYKIDLPKKAFDLLENDSIGLLCSFRIKKEILPLIENYISYEIPENFFQGKRFNNINTAYYENGYLCDVSPRNPLISLDENREIAYQARYIVSDGVRYDLYSIKDINKIKIPNFADKNSGSGIISFVYTTRNFSYILKMNARREEFPLLAVPLIYKAANVMIHSDIGWGKKDYMSLVNHLLKIGEEKHADHLLNELNNALPFMTDDNYFKKCQLKQQLKIALDTNNDLMEITGLATTCSECAKYQCRVYSILGRDTRFPKMPEDFFEYAGIHEGCHHSFFSYYGGKIVTYVYDEYGNCNAIDVDAIEYSNRPFVDNRSTFEKERYEKMIAEKQKKKEREKTYEENRLKSYRTYSKRKKEFDWICENLPETAPKSIAGYTKMKNSNSKNYQKLKQLAAEKGFKLEDGI